MLVKSIKSCQVLTLRRVFFNYIRLQEENKIKEQKIKEIQFEKDVRVSNLENVVAELTKRLDSKK